MGYGLLYGGDLFVCKGICIEFYVREKYNFIGWVNKILGFSCYNSEYYFNI